MSPIYGEHDGALRDRKYYYELEIFVLKFT